MGLQHTAFYVSGVVAGEIKVGGVAVTIKEGTLSIVDRIEAPSVASFTILDPLGATHYQEFQPVSIRDWDGELVFAGFIDTVREVRLAPDGYLIHHLSCKDNTWLVYKLFANKAYSATLAGDIVKDLRTTYLAAEGVTEGTIENGSSRTIDFSYVTVAEALARLAAIEGKIWLVDHEKRLHFHSRTTRSAAWNLTEDDALDGKTTVLRNNPRYRNRQIVTGGYALIEDVVETQAGDGERRTFTMPYDLASAPTIEVSGGPGGTWVAQTVGLVGETGKDWYWSPGSREIIQDSEGTPLPAPGPSGTQEARPDSDVSNDAEWTSSGANFFGVLDEAVADDADKITVDHGDPGGVGKAVRVGLSNVTDPGVDTNHVIRIRGKKNAGSGNDSLFVEIYGSGFFVQRIFTFTTSFSDLSYALPQSVAADITDYEDLEMRFLTSNTLSSKFDISQAYLQIPASGEPAPPPGGIGWIRVTFDGRGLATVILEDAAEIAAVAALEGGSGKVEAVHVATGQEAMPIAEALLDRYGKRGIQLQSQTLRSGLKVGENLHADLADHGITTAKDLLIETIEVRHRGTHDHTDEFVYTVKASENVVRGGAAELFSAIARQLGSVVEPA